MIASDTIEKWYANGIIPLPIKEGEKRPNFQWKDWIENKPSLQMVKSQFDKNRGGAVGILCGRVELIDIDVKNDPDLVVTKRFFDKLNDNFDLMIRLVIEQTPSGGYHIWYKVPEGSESQSVHLAVRASDNTVGYNVVIETRGEGGQGLCAPSPGYVLQPGSAISDIVEISNEDRQWLWNIAFEASMPPEKITEKSRPGDDYNAKVDVATLIDMLQSAGWEPVSSHRSGWVNFTRPDAKHKNKVDGGLCTTADPPYFYNLSSGAAWQIPIHTSISPFALYAYLEHRGDFHAAAKALADQGYGKSVGEAVFNKPIVPEEDGTYKFTLEEEQEGSFVEEMKDSEFLSLLQDSRFSTETMKEIDFDFFINTRGSNPYDNPRIGVGFKGALVALFGEQKSRKTTVLLAMIAAAIRGESVLNFEWTGKKNVLLIDTEQVGRYYNESIMRLMTMAGIKNPPNLFAYSTAHMKAKERIHFVDRAVRILNPDILVIDGIRDLGKDYNDLAEATFLLNCVAAWQTLGCTVFTVLHLTKGDKSPRGHLGNTLIDKADSSIKIAPVDDYIIEIEAYRNRGQKWDTFALRAGVHNLLYDHNLSKDFPSHYDLSIFGSKQPQQSQQVTTRDEDVPF